MRLGRARHPILATAALALASCLPAAAQTGGGCAGMASTTWSAAGKAYRVTAVSSGSNCAMANVTLTIRSPSGRALVTFASAAADLPLIFADATTPAAIGAGLKRWIEQRSPARTTRDLPMWETDKEAPHAEGSVRFQPEPLVTRGEYMDRRRWGQPMFCFLQGAESEACYALDGRTDTMMLLGTQMLPG